MKYLILTLCVVSYIMIGFLFYGFLSYKEVWYNKIDKDSVQIFASVFWPIGLIVYMVYVLCIKAMDLPRTIYKKTNKTRSPKIIIEKNAIIENAEQYRKLVELCNEFSKKHASE